VVGKDIDSTINQIPWIALATPVEMKITFVFHQFIEKSNRRLGLFKTHLNMSVRSDVILLGVKLKVAIFFFLSIHN
jgi:hypothetical protein